jgi:hypothetical protein
MDGIYTDPFHAPTKASANIFGFASPWFGGLRFIGSSKETPTKFTTIGCDDGYNFWTLTGESTGSASVGEEGAPFAVDMDFTPKAPGVGLLKCSYTPGALSFLNDDGTVGNTWSRLKPKAVDATADAAEGLELLEKATKFSAFNEVNGLYVDLSVYKPGSFAGIRVVSDRLGKILRDEICIVGTDDGDEWWSMDGGAFVDKSTGKFRVGSLVAVSSNNGTIRLEDGTEWIKMVPKSDFHSLPN